MNALERSATAYGQLSALTDRYVEGQALLQVLRVLSRAMKDAAVTYATEDNVDEPIGQALVRLTELVGIERQRLYTQGSRLSDEMTRLNALIQNGGYNG